MARTPNYNFERKERERIRAAKKAEKQTAKAAKNEPAQPENSESVSSQK